MEQAETSPKPQGHDGPYGAPVTLPEMEVRTEWIDYNGHMNVAYYTQAFDLSLDRLIEDNFGIGEAFARDFRMGPYALQCQIHFMGELMEGERFFCRAYLVDHDTKRLHMLIEMVNAQTGAIAAVMENLTMNVDLEARRGAAYPDWALARIARWKAEHEGVELPPQVGARIGIRRKG